MCNALLFNTQNTDNGNNMNNKAMQTTAENERTTTSTRQNKTTSILNV